ncbi:MAG: hypothetical protein ABIK73_07055 [candidate division WOR-3 bacterium]
MKICASRNISTEYKSGLPVQRVVEYLVVLPLGEHFNNLELAEENIRNHPFLVGAEELRIRYDSTNQENEMLFIVEAVWVDETKKAENVLWETTSTLEQTETVFDAFGNLITVQYYPDIGSEPIFQVVPVRHTRPRMEIRMKSLDDWNDYFNVVPIGVNPIGYMTAGWLNKINSTNWLGFAMHTVLCTYVSVSPFYVHPSGQRYIYESQFSFIFDPETHNRIVYYRNEDGKTPTNIDLISGNGARLVQVYQDTDFNLLFPLAGKVYI